ncbi:MAG TPA: exodeoxyribonuclease VII large subunit [Tepidisphaeraceae bacterium]|nr:exodeoxyribonuclease VII large subunit [Tepidisphaeraceae bacterium]
MSGSSFFDFYERNKKRPESAKPPDREPVSVSELTRQIDRAIKSTLPPVVLVRGEISNYKHHAVSGNVYFTLKDADACIDCVMFKSERASLKFEPRDGMELIATGRVAIYAQRGRYQLYVSQLQPLGIGSLELAFKQLHAKLLAEGLFDADRKRPIPKYPIRIALLTSTETAALQDMLKVLRRFEFLKLCIYHVPVQGDGAAEKIAAGIESLNRRRDVEVILLARGGGSLEDLWEFNEECVARAIVASRIPVVTGIGHEIDVSIADLVADYHAHTPTEAAQVVTAHWRQAGQFLDSSAVRLAQTLRRLVETSRHRLNSIERHEIFRRPMDRINTLRQLLDDQQRELVLQLQGMLARNREKLDRLAMRLADRHPRHRLQLENQRLESAKSRLAASMRYEFDRRRQKIEALGGHLSAIAPEQVLRRGYSITRIKKTGKIIRAADNVRAGDRLMTQLSDGEIESTVADAKQPELFE